MKYYGFLDIKTLISLEILKNSNFYRKILTIN